MEWTIVRYKTKADEVQKNERLIQDVFRELREKSPDGVRYMALNLGDGTFVHVASDGAGSISALEAFASFRSGIEERCVESPHVDAATIVGSYRMPDD
jgi:hypothetical protein